MENNDNSITKASTNAYKKTSKSLESLRETFPEYTDIFNTFQEGVKTVELRKRFMLKQIDEAWVRAIEDTLSSIDLIIRRPGVILQEDELILPVELTRKINGRSVQHLSQHTDYINEIRDDGTIVPQKLLNIFQDDTILTYENKFINTLLYRLYAFVTLRYSAAQECGEDEKNTKLTFNQTFEKGDKHGKITLSIEVSEPPKESESVKNYIYTSDLWKRVKNIKTVVDGYMGSKFVKLLGKNYVHPPIMRTNKLLKNVDFRQCLSLWEFLETYENTGYETKIFEDLENISEDCIRDYYNTIGAQYLLFQKHIRNEFEDENTLDKRTIDNVTPVIKNELDDFDIDEYSYKNVVKKPSEDQIQVTGEEDEIEKCIQIAIGADLLVMQREDEEEAKRIAYKYRYSFLARLILAQNPVQDWYSEIKNELLSYQTVKNKISWKYEAFNSGRKRCSILNVKGKTLYVYLPLNVADYEGSKYNLKDASSTKQYQNTPALLKVKSERGVKYAKELIAIVMSALGLAKNPDYISKDFHMPLQTIESLLKKDLVRLVDGTKFVSDEEEQKNLEFTYRYSFMSRLILAQNPLQDYYTTIKNELMSYKNVRDTLSWRKESFLLARKKCASINIKGKALYLYLPLNVNDYVDSKYFLKDESKVKQYEDTPALLKVKSERGVKYAIELIAIVMKSMGAEKIADFVPTDYHKPLQTIEELLQQDLIRYADGRVVPKPEAQEVPQEPVDGEDKKDLEFTYRYSFMSRLILAQNPLQDYYNEIKNEFLSYNRVKETLSWRKESFLIGREKCGILNIKGKALYVYLPLNVEEFKESKYFLKDASKVKQTEDTPALLKVKSDRGVKYAKELIAIVMANFGVEKQENFQEVDYHMPLQTMEELLQNDLIRYADGRVVPKPEVQEVPQETTPIVEENNADLEFVYRYSYQARLILAQDPIQNYYTEIKNELLSYNRVKETLSWRKESFLIGREKCCTLNIKGKALYVYFPLNVEDFKDSKYFLKDASKVKQTEDTPALLKVKSDRGVKYAKELIAIVMANFGVEKQENFQEVDYHMPLQSIEELLQNDLVRYADGRKVEVKPVAPETPAQEVQTAVEEEEKGLEFNYRYSYKARLILAQDPIQNYYTEIKNEFLSYNRVKETLSWRKESFLIGREKCGILNIKGKALYVYLPLNVEEFKDSKYFLKDASSVKQTADTPALLKVKSDRGVKYAKELIAIVMANFNVEKKENFQEVDYHMPLQTIEELLSENLVELISEPKEKKELITSQVKEEVVPTVVETPNEPEENEEIEQEEAKGFMFKYKYSFTSRLILSQNPTQDFYTEIKNEFLSYEKVKSSISWTKETFLFGREKCGCINIRGKNLYLYLPLQVSDFSDSKYFLKEATQKMLTDTPALLKVKSERGVKYAKELIAIVMNNLNTTKNDTYLPVDYHHANQSLDSLIKKGLVKLAKGTTFVPSGAKLLPEFKYRYSYSSRLILLQNPTQDFYGEIKNEFLSYKKVKALVSFRKETFKCGRTTCAVLGVRGKTLCLYFPFKLEDYKDTKYNLKDVSNMKAYQNTPALLKVKSERGVKYAKELIKDLMNQLQITQNEGYVKEDFHMPLKTFNKLIKEGLIVDLSTKK